MAGVNDLIADLSIRHQVGVQRLGSSVVKRLMPILDRADADIVKKIMLSDRALDNSFGTKRLQALLEALRDIRHNAQIDFNKGLLAELRKLATYESAFQIGLLAKALPVVMDIVSPTSQMLTAAVTARPFQGALLRDWLTGMEATAVRRVKEAITQGVIQGETIQDMVRRIRGSRALNYRDGVMTTSRRGAETMVRTAVSHVTSAARDILYEENRDIIAKEKWLATLDTRTCPQCQGLDGKTFEVGKGVRTPAHLSCRCVRIPVLKTWREMGFDIDELEPGTRASMNGQVSASLNYNDWLKQQSAAVQDEALGPTRGAMFRRGGMTVDSFTNRAGDELTLEQLRKRDGDSLATEIAPIATPRDYVLKQQALDGNEHLVITEGGENLFTLTSGARTAVSIPIEAQRVMMDPKRDLSVFHNHPIDKVSFSPADLRMFAQARGVTLFTAETYSVSFKLARTSRTPQITNAVLDRLTKQYNALHVADFTAGRISIRDLENNRPHYIAKELHRLGYLKYSWEGDL